MKFALKYYNLKKAANEYHLRTNMQFYAKISLLHLEQSRAN